MLIAIHRSLINDVKKTYTFFNEQLFMDRNEFYFIKVFHSIMKSDQP